VNWLIGFCIAGLIALLACRLRLLTAGGASAAVVVGTSVFGAGGVWSSLPMVGFFFTSSLLPRVLGRPHAIEQRTAAQVLANGLAPTLCCWGTALLPAYAEAFWLGYLASVATATADTWATEFGVRFGNPVWHITTRRRIPAGESGGGQLAGHAGRHGRSIADCVERATADAGRRTNRSCRRARLHGDVSGQPFGRDAPSTVPMRSLCNADRAHGLLRRAYPANKRAARHRQQRRKRA
jgi:hypothetical protein